MPARWTHCILLSSTWPSMKMRSGCRVGVGCSFPFSSWVWAASWRGFQAPVPPSGTPGVRLRCRVSFSEVLHLHHYTAGDISSSGKSSKFVPLHTYKLGPFPHAPIILLQPLLASGPFSSLLPLLYLTLRSNWLCSHFTLSCPCVASVGTEGLAMAVEKGRSFSRRWPVPVPSEAKRLLPLPHLLALFPVSDFSLHAVDRVFTENN